MYFRMFFVSFSFVTLNFQLLNLNFKVLLELFAINYERFAEIFSVSGNAEWEWFHLFIHWFNGLPRVCGIILSFPRIISKNVFKKAFYFLTNPWLETTFELR